MVQLVDRFDVEAELAQIVHIAAPARAGMIYWRAATFACGHERSQSPCLTPSNGDHRAVIVADADADSERDRAPVPATVPAFTAVRWRIMAKRPGVVEMWQSSSFEMRFARIRRNYLF